MIQFHPFNYKKPIEIRGDRLYLEPFEIRSGPPSVPIMSDFEIERNFNNWMVSDLGFSEYCDRHNINWSSFRIGLMRLGLQHS